MSIRVLPFPVLALAGLCLAAGPAFAQPPAVPERPPAAPGVPPPVQAAPARTGVLLPVLPVLPALPDVAALTDQALAAAADALAAGHAHLATDVMALPGVQMALAMKPGLWFVQERERTEADRERARAMREQADRTRERDRESRMYEEAQRALDQSRWEQAITRFNDVVVMKGSRVDAALYWKAYAQDRQGLRAEALATIGTLTQSYPNSRYLQQAKVLEAEVRRNAGQPVRPQDQADEELKIMALNSLMQSSPEQAVPTLEKLLQGTASPKIKNQALFVLAQSDAPQAREVLKGHAKGNSTPELQARAIQYLGTHGGRESRAALAEIYGATQDVDMRKRILRAFMVSGEKDRLIAAAQTEQNPELRAEAVRQLGVMGAQTELAQMYQKESSVEVKKQIIQAMFVSGNASRLIELAKSEPNAELRRTAIRNLGVMGNKGTADALVEIYGAERDVELKKAVIQALAIQSNGAALVALARKEQDPALKRDIVQRMSHIKSDVVTQYMMELLNSK